MGTAQETSNKKNELWPRYKDGPFCARRKVLNGKANSLAAQLSGCLNGFPFLVVCPKQWRFGTRVGIRVALQTEVFSIRRTAGVSISSDDTERERPNLTPEVKLDSSQSRTSLDSTGSGSQHAPPR